MPTSYTGNGSALALRAAVTIPGIADTEALNAANIALGPDKLADFLDQLKTYGVQMSVEGDGINAVNAKSIDLTGPGESAPSLWYSGTPAKRKLLGRFNTTSLGKCVRIYAEGSGATLGAGGFVVTINAAYTTSWNQDTGAEDSYAWRFGSNGTQWIHAPAALFPACSDATFWGLGSIHYIGGSGEPAFVTGSNISGEHKLAYWVSPSGEVCIQGGWTGPALGELFQLPSSALYPTANAWSGMSRDGVNRFVVNSSGQVVANGASSGTVTSYVNLRYRVDHAAAP